MDLRQGDCLELMRDIPDGSVDLVVADLPYGTTRIWWDSIIPLDRLWAHYRRVAKPNAAFVFTATQPFTTTLICSNKELFRYAMVWDKVNRFTGHLNAKKMPMRSHEDVLVFYGAAPTYNPQTRQGVRYQNTRSHPGVLLYGSHSHEARKSDGSKAAPGSIISIKSAFGNDQYNHPTQKPVELFEYIIETYSNPGDMVLDSCMGGGSSGVACVRTKRRFTGLELEPGYFQVAQDHILQAQTAPRLAL